jgi:hypothetical protein
MKTNRRGFMGMGLGGIIGGKDVVKEVADSMEKEIFEQGTVPDMGFQAMAPPIESSFAEIQGRLADRRRKLDDPINKDIQYRREKNMRSAVHHQHIESLKSVSGVHKVRMLHEGMNKEDDNMRKWNMSKEIERFISRWKEKFPMLK